MHVILKHDVVCAVWFNLSGWSALFEQEPVRASCWPRTTPWFQIVTLPLPNDYSKLDNILFNKPEPEAEESEV